MERPGRRSGMATPIQVEALVTADGKLEIAVPGLAPGQRVRVSIEPEAAAQEPPERSAAEILAEMPGHPLFKTAEEVDAYINEERDSVGPLTPPRTLVPSIYAGGMVY